MNIKAKFVSCFLCLFILFAAASRPGFYSQTSPFEVSSVKAISALPLACSIELKSFLKKSCTFLQKVEGKYFLQHSVFWVKEKSICFYAFFYSTVFNAVLNKYIKTLTFLQTVI